MPDLRALGVVRYRPDLAFAGFDRGHVRTLAARDVALRRQTARGRAFVRDARRQIGVHAASVVGIGDPRAGFVRLRRAGIEIGDDAAARIVEAARVDGGRASIGDASPAVGLDARELAMRSPGLRAGDRQDARRRERPQRRRRENSSTYPHAALPIGAMELIASGMSSPRRACSILALFALGVATAACSSADSGARVAETASAQPAPPGPVEIASCGVGKMLGAGGTACVTVGPTDVPAGFARVADAWGFRAINPFGNCPDRFFSSIGDTICVAIDHPCSNLTPAGATLVHDQPELVAALAASKPGATIALAGGTYEPIVVDRDVKLIGACPEKVVIRGKGAGSRGIEVRGPHSVSVRSLSISDAEFAVWATDGATVTVVQSRFSGNECAAWIEHGATLKMNHSLFDGAGAKMADGVLVARGGHAELEDAELRGMHVALQAFGEGSTAKGSALVISDSSPEARSALVVASHGGDVQVDRSLIFANDTFIGGATATDPREVGTAPAKLRITSSELLRVLPTESGGFDVSGGSTLELVNTTFETRARVAISAETGAKVLLERTVIRPVLPTDPADGGVGAGLIINDDVRLTLDRSAVMGVLQSAIMASRGCHIRATGSLIADVWEFSRTDFGKRFDSGQAISLSGDAVLELSDSVLQNNAGASIWMDRGGKASVKVERSVIVDTREADRSTAAVGLLAWSGTVDVRDSLVHGIPGTALAFGDATGAIAGTTISRGDVAFRFLGQSRTVAAVSDDQRPGEGELLTRANIVVETTTASTEDPLPLGECRCEKVNKQDR
ncbi:MAG: hypothetical protein JWP87_3746 [Labilithrix sp.]|nr:hypothetical protein [Labilithrix sp.]